jgi:hypothetical protein
MPTKLENVAKGFELFNLVFPNLANLVVTLKSGKEVNIKDLMDDTEQHAEGKIQEANDFLNRD